MLMDLTGGTAKAGTWLWEPQAMRCVEENAGVLVGGVGSQGLPLLGETLWLGHSGVFLRAQKW